MYDLDYREDNATDYVYGEGENKGFLQYNKIPALLDQLELIPTEHRLMNMVVKFTQNNRRMIASYVTIGDKLGVSARTTKRYVAGLCAKGLLVKIKTQIWEEGKGVYNESNEYRPSMLLLYGCAQQEGREAIIKINRAFKLAKKMLSRYFKAREKLGASKEELRESKLYASTIDFNIVSRINEQELEKLGIEVNLEIRKTILEGIELANRVNNDKSFLDSLAKAISEGGKKVGLTYTQIAEKGVVTIIKKIRKVKNDALEAVEKALSTFKNKAQKIENDKFKEFEKQLSNSEEEAKTRIVNMTKIRKKGKALAKNIGASENTCIALMELIKSRNLDITVKQISRCYKIMLDACVKEPLNTIYQQIAFCNGLGLFA